MQKKQKKPILSVYRLLLVVVIGYFVYVIASQQYDIFKIHQEEKAVNIKLEQVKKEHETLLKEKQLLNDPAYIEKVAREELGLVKDGEVPYIQQNKP